MVDLSGFPTFTVTDQVTLYRAHGFAHLPAYYSSSGRGRFDLQSPRGTVYLAFEPLAPFLESYRDSPDFDEAQGQEKGISRYTLRQSRVVLADCTDPRAGGFGVPDWLHDCEERDYPKTQAWGRSFEHADYGGILYWSRYARRVGLGLQSIALFGASGGRRDLPETFERFPPEVIDRARGLGLTVSFEPDRPVRTITLKKRS